MNNRIGTSKKDNRNRISYKKLRELLEYDPETGVFTFRSDGSVAGNVSIQGYVIISLNGKNFPAHRLAWLYVHGYLPENDIDHIDRIRDNNRISNLREVSRVCNLRNSKCYKNNNCGVKGVGYHSTHKKWQPSIKVFGKLYCLGLYEDFDDAVCARLAAEQCLGWSGCDKSSTALRYVKEVVQGNSSKEKWDKRVAKRKRRAKRAENENEPRLTQHDINSMKLMPDKYFRPLSLKGSIKYPAVRCERLFKKGMLRRKFVKDGGYHYKLNKCAARFTDI